MKLFKNKKGITLVELLAVLVILGIIAAIAVPTVSTLIDNTRDRANVETANAYIQAARLYSLENPSNTTVAATTLEGDYLTNSIDFLDGNDDLITDLVFVLNNGVVIGFSTTPNAVQAGGQTTSVEFSDNSFKE